MTSTIGALLSARAASIVGRQAEREVLARLVTDDAPIVVAVHGIAGVGKSAVIAAFAADARAHGAAVVLLDCRTVEPTEQGFLAALAEVVGQPVASAAEAAAVLGGLGERVVLALDTYEVLRLLDTWLRHDLVPVLPANVRLLLAGRERPMAAWIATFGDLLLTLPLENLAPVDAEALLVREGVPRGESAAMNRLAHAHPLALRLAAAARTGRPWLTVPDAAITTVVADLAAEHLAGLDAATRAVLDAAGVVRRPTL